MSIILKGNLVTIFKHVINGHFYKITIHHLSTLVKIYKYLMYGHLLKMKSYQGTPGRTNKCLFYGNFPKIYFILCLTQSYSIVTQTKQPIDQ